MGVQSSLDGGGNALLLAQTSVAFSAGGSCPFDTTRVVGPFGGTAVVLPDPTGPCPDAYAPTRVTFEVVVVIR